MIEKLKKARKQLKWADPFHYADLLLARLGYKDNQAISLIVYLATAYISALALYLFLGLLFQSPAPMVIVVSGSMEPAFYRGDVMVLSGWDRENFNAPRVELDMAIDGKDLSEYAHTLCSVKGLDELVQCRAIQGLSGEERRLVEAKKIVFFPLEKEIEIKKEGNVVVYWSESQQKPIIHRAVAEIHAKDGLFLLTKGDSELNSFIDQDTYLSLDAVKASEIQGKAIFMVPKIGYVKLILLDDLPCYLFNPNKQYCQFP